MIFSKGLILLSLLVFLNWSSNLLFNTGIFLHLSSSFYGLIHCFRFLFFDWLCYFLFLVLFDRLKLFFNKLGFFFHWLCFLFSWFRLLFNGFGLFCDLGLFFQFFDILFN